MLVKSINFHIKNIRVLQTNNLNKNIIDSKIEKLDKIFN